FARVDIANDTQGFTVTVTADAAGRFTAVLDAAPGDAIRVVVYDLAQSAEPSAPAIAVAPAPRALPRTAVEPTAFARPSAGATRDLAVTAFYDDGTSETPAAGAAWTTNNAAVATVSVSGRVVAKGSGTATITARLGAFTAEAVATVAIRTLQSISVSPASVVLPAIGATQAVTVTGHHSDGTTAAFTSGVVFASSAPAVIGVTAGTVQALAAGSAVITVSASGVPPVQVPVSVDTGADEAPTVEFLSPAARAGFERGADRKSG